ncbi:MAG TPA: DUF1003 domain-containing protein [Clostridiales bacterium]|jgi:uncharacterized membrane protein|nr:DUF1003 domain-containing protein [Clostridiales bacterium]
MPVNEDKLHLLEGILDSETLSQQGDEVLHALLSESLAKNTVAEHETGLTRGQRAADAVARFAGSWGFILAFFVVMLFWIILNVYVLRLEFLRSKPFDPYPFILMNLVLSCVAAIQAPIIMMSQNRQEEKDRKRAENDFKINVKSEIIIEDIHRKLDSIISAQEQLRKKLDALEKSKDDVG